GIESARACVVWTWHREVAEAIASALRENGVSCAVAHGDHTPEERQAQVDALQSGEVKCLVATIKACGVGLTMTAANWTVFAELSWTPADIEQAEDRLHRIGQDETVLVQYLVVDQSLDAYIAQTMERKAAVIGAITE
ncbi:MAG: ATP-dependent helicase, partial [Candidatus Thermofonsia Clade 3 bacterium]